MKGPLTLLKEAYTRVADHIPLFFMIYLVPGLLLFVVEFLDGKMKGTGGEDMVLGAGLASGLGLAVVFVVIVQVLMTIAMMKAAEDPEATTAMHAYEEGWKMFVPVLWVSVLSGAAIILGLVALVIPGIILGVWFVFSTYVVLFENVRGVDALKASRAYTEGKWWDIFGRLAFLVVISLLVGIGSVFIVKFFAGFFPQYVAEALVSFLLGAIMTPLAIVYIYLMYQDVRHMKPVVVEQEDNTQSLHV